MPPIDLNTTWLSWSYPRFFKYIEKQELFTKPYVRITQSLSHINITFAFPIGQQNLVPQHQTIGTKFPRVYKQVIKIQIRKTSWGVAHAQIKGKYKIKLKSLGHHTLPCQFFEQLGHNLSHNEQALQHFQPPSAV